MLRPIQLQVNLFKNASGDILPNMYIQVGWEGERKETSWTFVLVEGMEVRKSNWKDMFISRTWQCLKLCIWKTLIPANPLQLIWSLLDFIILFLWYVSTSLVTVLGHKRFWFCFPNVSPPGRVLAQYLMMVYQVIYNEHYYYNTLGMDIQWDTNDCTSPNATAHLNERVYGLDRDHIKKHW